MSKFVIKLILIMGLISGCSSADTWQGNVEGILSVIGAGMLGYSGQSITRMNCTERRVDIDNVVTSCRSW